MIKDLLYYTNSFVNDLYNKYKYQIEELFNSGVEDSFYYNYPVSLYIKKGGICFSNQTYDHSSKEDTMPFWTISNLSKYSNLKKIIKVSESETNKPIYTDNSIFVLRYGEDMLINLIARGKANIYIKKSQKSKIIIDENYLQKIKENI